MEVSHEQMDARTQFFLSRASTIHGTLHDIGFIYICDRNFEQRGSSESAIAYPKSGSAIGA